MVHGSFLCLFLAGYEKNRVPNQMQMSGSLLTIDDVRKSTDQFVGELKCSKS